VFVSDKTSPIQLPVQSAAEARKRCDKGITVCRWISLQNPSNPRRFSHKVKKYYKGCIPRRIHRICQGVLCFQNVMRFHGTRIKTNFICAHKKSTIFLASTVTKLTNIQQNYAQTCTEFHPNGKQMWKVLLETKYDFNWASFNDNYDHWTNVCEYLLYWIVCKSHERRRKCGQNYIYALK
jgi:hypothetical protein